MTEETPPVLPKRLPVTRFYAVRHSERFGAWARIWITSDGTLSAVTDYGNFGYWWGQPGCEFRKFLTECEPEYVARKLAGGKTEVDADATFLAVKREILELRRRKALTRDSARDEWDDALKVDWDEPCERCEWGNTTELECLEDLICFRLPRQLMAFMEHLWPLFVALLRSELEAEEAELAKAAAVRSRVAWFYTGDKEDQSWRGGPFDSRGEAITAGRKEYSGEQRLSLQREEFVVASASLAHGFVPGDGVDAESIREQVSEYLMDNEAADRDGDGVDYIDEKAAEKDLYDWANKHIRMPDWWTIDGRPEKVLVTDPAAALEAP